MRMERGPLSAEQAREFKHASPARARQVAAHLTCECKPYVDIFTMYRWNAQGFKIRKGEKALVKVATFGQVTKTDDETGRQVTRRRRFRSALFCRCQVEPAARKWDNNRTAAQVETTSQQVRRAQNAVERIDADRPTCSACGASGSGAVFNLTQLAGAQPGAPLLCVPCEESENKSS